MQPTFVMHSENLIIDDDDKLELESFQVIKTTE